MPRRKLIINADDYGLSKKFNRGILELVEKGIVTSTTAMIKRKFIYPKDLLKHKNISVGFHLELSDKTSLKEIERQILKFKRRFQKLPSHLDGHQHCHLSPGNLPKVIKIAKKYNLPVRSRFLEDRKIIRKHKIKTPDRFLSWHPSRKTKLFENLRSNKAKVTELVCHPGYFDPKSKLNYNKQRKRELEILKSNEFKSLIKRSELINYCRI